jgi:hypothetical protein
MSWRGSPDRVGSTKQSRRKAVFFPGIASGFALAMTMKFPNDLKGVEGGEKSPTVVK